MKRFDFQQGMTLIEIMIAVSLFMVLMLAVSSSIPGLFNLNRKTTDTQRMSVYAKNVIDQTRSFWLTPSADTSSNVDHYPNLTSGNLPSSLPAVPSSLNCNTPAVAEVTKITAPTSTTATPVYWTTRRSITVSCRPASDSSAAYTDFVAEIGRPE